MVSKKEKLTFDQKLELMKLQLEITKLAGKGIIDAMKSGPVPRYTITSLVLLAMGKACILSPVTVGALQTANTVITLHEVIDESGGSLLGLDEIGQTLEAIGGGVAIGAVWGYESSRGIGGRGCRGPKYNGTGWVEQFNDMVQGAMNRVNQRRQLLTEHNERIKTIIAEIRESDDPVTRAQLQLQISVLQNEYDAMIARDFPG